LEINDIDLSKMKTNILNFCNSIKNKIGSEINQNSLIEKEVLKMLAGNRDEKIKIKYLLPNSEKPQIESIACNLTNIPEIQKPTFSTELEPGIIYLNASLLTDDDFKRILRELERDITKGIIFDFRGYSLLSEHTLGFFSKNAITNGISVVPQYYVPSKIQVQDKLLISSISPLEKLINKKVVFLMDSKTTSYSEYILGLAKLNKIGTIIGTQSQGNFTETNRVLLSGYYFATVSGQKFDFKDEQISNKSPLRPDIEVENKFDNYLKNEDLQLKAAVNFIREQK
jgi:C-terminal processing protease CtpA/Prc